MSYQGIVRMVPDSIPLRQNGMPSSKPAHPILLTPYWRETLPTQWLLLGTLIMIFFTIVQDILYDTRYAFIYGSCGLFFNSYKKNFVSQPDCHAGIGLSHSDSAV
jgi:hypothetical protein